MYGAGGVDVVGSLPEMQALMPTPAISTPTANAVAATGPRAVAFLARPA
jgi:hypothetical protein